MPESSEDTCDLIVVGSGAAGFSAAITGANAGLRVVMVEKAAVFGGTTAFSGGFMWIPGSSLAKASGVRDSRDDALTYIHALAGEYHDAGVAEAFLDAGNGSNLKLGLDGLRKLEGFFITHACVRILP